MLALGRSGAWTVIAVATLGNTLGSCMNWALGRYGAHWRHHPRFPVPAEAFDRYSRWYQRFGIWSLLASWLPVIGDPMTAIAGLMRTPFWVFVPLVAAGKLIRYLAVAGIVALF